jgi:hypothetical protein
MPALRLEILDFPKEDVIERLFGNGIPLRQFFGDLLPQGGRHAGQRTVFFQECVDDVARMFVLVASVRVSRGSAV